TLEGRNDSKRMLPSLGCRTQRVDNVERPLTPREVVRLGCRPNDRMDAGLVADRDDPETFSADGKAHLSRAYRTSRNQVTAWWDASPIYGYSERSGKRVRRDPA